MLSPSNTCGTQQPQRKNPNVNKWQVTQAKAYVIVNFIDPLDAVVTIIAEHGVAQGPAEKDSKSRDVPSHHFADIPTLPYIIFIVVAWHPGAPYLMASSSTLLACIEALRAFALSSAVGGCCCVLDVLAILRSSSCSAATVPNILLSSRRTRRPCQQDQNQPTRPKPRHCRKIQRATGIPQSRVREPRIRRVCLETPPPAASQAAPQHRACCAPAQRAAPHPTRTFKVHANQMHGRSRACKRDPDTLCGRPRACKREAPSGLHRGRQLPSAIGIDAAETP